MTNSNERDERLSKFDTGMVFPFSNSNEFNDYIEQLEESSGFVAANQHNIDKMHSIQERDYVSWLNSAWLPREVEKEEQRHHSRLGR